MQCTVHDLSPAVSEVARTSAISWLGSWQDRTGAPDGAVPTAFLKVPEGKSVKNRTHWDVTVPDVLPLIEAGATVVREPDDQIDWHVLADPEGNEFCAFTR